MVKFLHAQPLFRSTPVRRVALLVLLFHLAGAIVSLSAATFTASLDRNTVTVGDSVTLNLVCADGTVLGVPGPPPIMGITSREESSGRSSRVVCSSTTSRQ